jgi:hypothetical protein
VLCVVMLCYVRYYDIHTVVLYRTTRMGSQKQEWKSGG